MGRKLDLSRLTDKEAEHVMQVVQRDMRLRKKEEKRLSELKQELVEEGSRCLLLSQQSCFNQHCCIRCCNSFTFLLNPRRQCRDCGYYVCKACRVYCKQDKVWICCTCQKSRLFKTQSLEWFYNNVKKRFKRFGSSKVLKTFYRKHVVEISARSELTDGSTYEESVYNEGSICGSDSAFYRQSEEHSMEETFSVALRVAEEAVDEAISKANFEVGTQEQQDEAQHLQEHRAELIQQVAQTIVQKIINRGKSSTEMKPDHSRDWIQEQPESDSGFKQQTDCVGSHSAFSLMDEEHPLSQIPHQASKKEGLGSAMTTWKSLEWLDNPSVSSVLRSSDGNWFALQSTPLSHLGLLTKRKSLVYNALEDESGVVSPYEGFDNENQAEPDGLQGAVQQDVLKTRTDANDTDDNRSHQTNMPQMGSQGDRQDLLSDPEENWYHKAPQESLLWSNVGLEIRRPSSPRRTSIIDVNFNPEGSADENTVAPEQEVEILETSQNERRNQKDPASSLLDDNKRDTSDSLTPEPSEVESDLMRWRTNQKDRVVKQLQLSRQTSNSDSSTAESDGVMDCGRDEGQRQESREGREERDESDEMEENERDDEEMECRLYRLVEQSRLSYFSSTDDELDTMRQSDGEQTGDEDMEEVHCLEDPAEVTEGKRKTAEDEDEELMAKVCRLANEISAAQFSSTEDELDKVGLDDDVLWKLQREKIVQATQVRELASLVSASQFSSTEDELDKAGDEEPWTTETERRGAGGDVDVEPVEKVKRLQRKEENQELEFGEMSAETMATGSKIQKDNQPEMKRTERQDEDDEKLDRIIDNMLMMMVKEEHMKSDTHGHETGFGESGLDARWTNQLNESTSEDVDETRVCLRREETSDEKHGVRRKRDEEERIETDKMLEEFKSKQAESTEQSAANRRKALRTLEDNRCRSSAESLRSITTEVLKVLNATEDMLQGVETGDEPRLSCMALPPHADPRKLDQQFSRLEENVYIAAGAVCSLEAELSDLEECARAISTSTSDMELSFLEEQVATAAAKAQQSELQICNISARIAALKSAGLNVDPTSHLTKGRIRPPLTLDSSRHLRRRLPAPPVNDNKKN